MDDNLFDDFSWHSALEMDDVFSPKKVFVTRIAATPLAMSQFVASGDYLIHKATTALWKFSKDKKTIEPVFGSDILTDEDLKQLEQEPKES